MSAPAPGVIAGGVRGAGQGPFTYDLPVYVSGLQGRVDLNNRGARICERTPRKGDGRIGIQMLRSPDTQVWIKPENLTVLTFAGELHCHPYSQMSDAELQNMGMYMYTSRGSTPVPGMKAVSIATFTDDRPLTEREKDELLRVGQWGANTSQADWHALVLQIKNDRNNVYPRDWHSAVVSGAWFEANGQPVRDCMTISSDLSVLPGFGGDADAGEEDEDDEFFDADGDDIFSLEYPSYREADKWVDNASIVHGSEYSKHAHNALKKVFESKHDPEVIAQVGRELNQRGGFQSMQCNFYNYNVVTTTICVKAQISEYVYRAWWGDARVTIENAWCGIGDWKV